MNRMTDKERLIELLEQEKAFTRYLTDDEHREQLADYLLENGVAVLPCNVGDTVYLMIKGCIEIMTGRVTRISYDKYGKLVICIQRKQGNFYTTGNHRTSSFGKTVFLTREEAEQALKGA